ncbi:hypothetical protein SAMN05880570_2529 [Paenibacillus sp. RU4T]|nr:hypothetical protein SAMN05880555_2530 [Paenibacillus sp. RU4X]SIR06508.1 hypothetical protein SAMN05880570_2529 [Paenibacillus sp. RU4T]
MVEIRRQRRPLSFLQGHSGCFAPGFNPKAPLRALGFGLQSQGAIPDASLRASTQGAIPAASLRASTQGAIPPAPFRASTQGATPGTWLRASIPRRHSGCFAPGQPQAAVAGVLRKRIPVSADGGKPAGRASFSIRARRKDEERRRGSVEAERSHLKTGFPHSWGKFKESGLQQRSEEPSVFGVCFKRRVLRFRSPLPLQPVMTVPTPPSRTARLRTSGSVPLTMATSRTLPCRQARAARTFGIMPP